jgi:predicted amidohydrolase/GNAT superfamily N-acetyltransferase
MTQISKIEVRHLRLEDYSELKKVMLLAYKDLEGSYWREYHIKKLLDIFPQGQLVVIADDKVVGCALSIIVNSEDVEENHTYKDITGTYTFDTHTPAGDTLYGIDVFISPEYRGLRLGRRLYDVRKELCEQLNLKSIVFGGRIPGYKEHADKLTPKEYIQKVKFKELYDPVLTFQLSNDFHVLKVMKGYLPDDVSSQEYATLLEWSNIYYTKSKKVINTKKSVVRLGLVQWQMRPLANVEMLYEQMEYFVDAVSDYSCDFALFPELFNAPLMSAFNHLPEADAIRMLAQYTESIKLKFQEFAIAYNINIITGSMPLVENEKLYNVGFLCRRNGTTEMFKKLHITPSEAYSWGMVGGDEIRIFDTDSGKIGILICYDSEFPELSRLLADEGMQILFVPFLTDTPNGFHRVKRCAQARAIENECYVAIAGSVGNLPKVSNMDIQFAQSAVFTPCDFAFPTDGVKAEATPNTEMILICDVDLDLLQELHVHGSVNNLKDRRKDVYKIVKKPAAKPDEVPITDEAGEPDVKIKNKLRPNAKV